MKLNIIFDFVHQYIMKWNIFFSMFLKGCFTVKWCHFLNLPECSSSSHTCLYPLSHYIHITDSFLSKISLWWCYSTNTWYCINTVMLQYKKYWDIGFCRPDLTFMKFLKWISKYHLFLWWYNLWCLNIVLLTQHLRFCGVNCKKGQKNDCRQLWDMSRW